MRPLANVKREGNPHPALSLPCQRMDPKAPPMVAFISQLMPSATFNFRAQFKHIIYSAIVD